MRHDFSDIPSSKYAELIPLINSLSSYNLFTEKKTCLQSSLLSFFRKHRLLSAHTFSTIPPVTMHYLWNEENNDIIKMEGTRDAIFNHLDKLELILNEKTVVPYVKFVLDSVWTDKGSLRLVEDMGEVEFSDNPLPEDLQFLKETVRPATVTPTGGGYRIDATIIYGTEIYQSVVDVQEWGTFDFLSETELRAGVSSVRIIFLE
ncbi:MAG: hypothetical protein WC191_03420 [Proteiniphilum sp.]|nr:hypothetical protein [Candidatus Cloacimonadota bacterium]MDD2330037.1 hypothetical protein [Bacteroidales bacterium]MDD3332830.1 hypothetical protein [Proteiniphilum sp.]MDD5345457.1 hypothetical protein [Proteiniphilum sp.]MDD5619643.1 hypothetical protein [Proteiniphilum sp.]